MIDPSTTWDEIARFHESSLVTTGSLHGNIREQQLVKKFLENVSLEVLFQVLQTVSDEDREDKVIFLNLFRISLSYDFVVFNR